MNIYWPLFPFLKEGKGGEGEGREEGGGKGLSVEPPTIIAAMFEYRDTDTL